MWLRSGELEPLGGFTVAVEAVPADTLTSRIAGILRISMKGRAPGSGGTEAWHARGASTLVHRLVRCGVRGKPEQLCRRA